MHTEYRRQYRELYNKHWWWRSRTELIIETIRRLRPLGGLEQILDIGCGDGLLFSRLEEFGNVEGVEPMSDLISANNPNRSRIYECPFDNQFHPDKQYSLILMLDVLEHLTEPVAALKQMMVLLKPGGAILITVPAFMSLWTNHDVLNHHVTRYTKRCFREIAGEARFKILEEHYFYHWTYPVKLGVRALESIFRPKLSPVRIPRRWANEALFWASRFEQKTLSVLDMPFGSSLMVVGTKETHLE